jgi:hypothetical protein
MKRLKTITSHAGHARWLAEISEEPVGYIARASGIPSPYAFSASHPVWEWNGRTVFWVETRHKRYEVFEVPAGAAIYPTHDAVCDASARAA